MGQSLDGRLVAVSRLPRLLIAAGALVPLLSGCGVKGPPKPPLSSDPQRVRGLTLRQSGPAIELTWSRPERRENGAPIASPMTYKVLARGAERARPPASPGSGTPAATAGAAASREGAAAREGAPVAAGEGAVTSTGGAAPAAGGSSSPGAGAGIGGAAPASIGGAGLAGPGRAGGPGESARAEEQAFLKTAFVVAEMRDEETAKPPVSRPREAHGPEAEGARDSGGERTGDIEGAVAHADAMQPRTGETSGASERRRPDFIVSLGPERFPGARFTAVRLAFAVVAVDARGRRSRPQPILEIDPIETLPPPEGFTAVGAPGGVQLSWRPPAAAGLTAVNVYRALAPEQDGAPPALPLTPIPGSPFSGEKTLDRTAQMGASYAYEARLVATSPGAGLRESLPAGPVRIDYRDRFPPGPPSLVTVDSVPEDAVRLSFSTRIAWSSPIDRDIGGFRIYRAKGDGSFSLAGQVDAGQNEWIDTHLGEGTYHYYVTAIDGALPPNESEKSETVDAILG